MNNRLQTILGERVDLLVVGGGIYGACLAQQAAQRGISVALIEATDFANGTSGQSLRILHGGLRYLQHVDLIRMRESIRARRRWMRRFPGLVAPQAFSLPTFGHGVRGKEALTIALTLNDLVSWDRNAGLEPDLHIPGGSVVSRQRAAAMYADFKVEGFNGAAVWHDALSLDSERLLMRLLVDASRGGARIANHAEARAVHRANGRVRTVEVHCGRTGATHQLEAGQVVTVIGPWTGDLLERSGLPTAGAGQFSLGMNLVLRDLPVEHGIGVPVQRQGSDQDALVRSGQNTYFLVPWRGHTLAGTRHFSIARGLAAADTVESCASRFVAEIGGLLRDPSRLSEDQVVAVLAGWLPEAGEVRPDRDPVLAKHPRIVDHASSGAAGLTTVVGVKWTTADVVAGQILDRVQPGGVAPARTSPPAIKGDDLRLVHGYGAAASEIEALGSSDPAMRIRLLESSRLTRAEIVWQVRNEWVTDLSDVVQRRNPLWLDPGVGDDVLGTLATWVGSELRWSENEVEAQKAEARSVLSRRRGPRAQGEGEPL